MLRHDLENYSSIHLTNCLKSELMKVLQKSQRNILNRKDLTWLQSLELMHLLSLSRRRKKSLLHERPRGSDSISEGQCYRSLERQLGRHPKKPSSLPWWWKEGKFTLSRFLEMPAEGNGSSRDASEPEPEESWVLLEPIFLHLLPTNLPQPSTKKIQYWRNPPKPPSVPFIMQRHELNHTSRREQPGKSPTQWVAPNDAS